MSTNPKLGKLFLIPLPISEGALHTIPAEVATHTAGIRHYFAENVRTARRFLRLLHPALVLEELQFSEIDKHNGADTALFKTWLWQGFDVGILSEAGCPCIADPGAELALIAQEMGVPVMPLTGPNAVILALMASGLNGQSFSFVGYLPVKDPLRSKAIKDLETRSAKEQQTQIFIETPYRNNQLLADLLRNCTQNTRICVAYNITAPDEWIKTRTVAEWKKNIPVMEKAAAVFLLLAKEG